MKLYTGVVYPLRCMRKDHPGLNKIKGYYLREIMSCVGWWNPYCFNLQFLLGLMLTLKVVTLVQQIADTYHTKDLGYISVC